MTLLISPADKLAIASRAEAPDISVSELVRRAALDYDPEEAAARVELEAFMPELTVAVDDIRAAFRRMNARLDETERRLAEMDGDAYREKVRQDLADDPAIDWDAARRAFGWRERAA